MSFKEAVSQTMHLEKKWQFFPSLLVVSLSVETILGYFQVFYYSVHEERKVLLYPSISKLSEKKTLRDNAPLRV